MAQMGVGIGGAIIGALAVALSAPTGGASLAAYAAAIGAGFAIGETLGGILFPTKGATVYGNRIGDLTVTASTYGVIRPVVFGNVQVAGNLIWGTPIKEVSTSSRVGSSGKGSSSKSGSTQVTYTYTSTFALALCEGPVEQIVRIWMNGAIAYDISAGYASPVGTDTSSPIANAVANLTSSTEATNNPSSPINFRFYPGNNGQLPDSLIEADKGVGNVPAYRGLCYLVFDELLLTNFGDRIPNVQVELTTSSVYSNNFQQLQRSSFSPTFEVVVDTTVGSTALARRGESGFFGFLPPSGVVQENVLETSLSSMAGAALSITYTNATVPSLFTGGYSAHGMGINPLTQLGYGWGTSPTGVFEFDLRTMNVNAEYSLDYIMGTYNTWGGTTITATNNLWVGFDQNLYGLLGSQVLKVNPGTMSGGVMLSMGNDDNLGSPFANNSASFAAPLGVSGPNGVQNFTIAAGGNMGSVRVVETGQKFSPTGNSFSGMCPGTYSSNLGTAFINGLTGTFLGVGGGAELFVDQITATVAVSAGITGISYSTTISYANILLLDAATIESGATGWNAVTPPCFDPIDGSIVFSAQVINGSPGNSYFIKVATSGLVYATLYPNNLLARGSGMTSDLRSGKFAVFTQDHSSSNQSAVEFDLSTGQVLQVFPWVLTNPNQQQVYSGSFSAILMDSSGPLTWDKIVVGLLSNVPPTLATVVTGICKMAGLQDSDIDVTGIADIPIDGYALAQRTTGADVLKPLLQLYQVDVVERNFVLVFQKRGGSVVTTITEDTMLRPKNSNNDNSQSEPWTETRIQEIDMPMRYTVSYIDESVQFQTNTQMAKRTVFPNRSMYSDQQIDLQVGLVMTAAAAAQAAEELLYAMWLARHTFKMALPPDYLFLDAADPVTLSLDNGYTARFRVGTLDMGMDNSLEVTLVSETEGQYVSTAPGQTGNIPPNVIPFFVPSKFFLLDTPLLRDIDDTAATAIRGYWGAAPYSFGTWQAAQLQGSADEDIWNAMDIEQNDCSYGTIEGVLQDAISTFHIFEADFINVRMQNGGPELSSCTITQLANYFNMAAVFKANGDIEVIQYLTVTALANNRYQLTGLARGVRGTDTMAGGHTVGETIVFLNTSVIDPLTLPLSVRGIRGFYRAVTAGTLPSAAPIQPGTFHGRDQMPYAPVQVTATLSGSDIVLAWNRRNRLAGGLIEGTGAVPLNENSEAYQIDIYDAGAVNVLRTLTAATPTVTYLAANITTDLGGTPSTLNVIVYQISASVGRGFGRLDALKVS